MDNNNIFASRVMGLQASAIREIFKLTGAKDIISLAGGNPAVESFPNKEFAAIAQEMLETNPVGTLQYGTTEGYGPLRVMVSDKMRKAGNLKDWDECIITTGGQQAIDLALKVLIEDGDGVIVEEPSFIGTLNSARSFNGQLHGVPVLDDGMDLDAAEEILKTKSIKMIYTIPTFQNPSGITMSLEKRKRLIELAEKYNVFILEDNPYGELRFEGEEIPTIKSMDTQGRVLYVGSFSKTLSSGLRVGYICARADIVEKIVVVKQVNDVHTPCLNQILVAEYMKRYNMDEHVEKIRQLYKKRCGVMLSAMDSEFPDYCKYTRPQGGLFILCTLPDGIDTKKMLPVAVENKVAFVPGYAFMVDIEKPRSIFRLNYSGAEGDMLAEGVSRLAKVIKDYVG